MNSIKILANGVMKIMIGFFLCNMLFIQCVKKERQSPVNALAIIPEPKQIELGEGSFTINNKTSIQVIGSEAVMELANYLSDMISSASSFEMKVEKAKVNTNSNTIVLELSESGNVESYKLSVATNHIRIKAPGASGLFYGVQTLRQLLPSAIEVKNKKMSSWTIPFITIQDEPAYPWRGMHLDVSRHFFDVSFIKQFIDRLALYKFNRLHLHLTDDQGWRLQINTYPQLTEKGAWRILNSQDSTCMKLAETNSDFALPEKFLKKKDGVIMYGGYYSQRDIKEIVRYAAHRFITIIPEIDMPGHMNAAITSFPELTCTDEGGWGKLFTIPLCPCEENTYEFINNVLTEVASLFPGEYIHIGADEVDESSWLKSQACEELLKKQGLKSSKELHTYFVNRVNKIVNKLGKKAIGWDEIVDGLVDSSIAVMYWRGWVSNAPALATRRGHNVIMSPTSHCYFDYEPDDTTLKHVYAFDPVPADVKESDKKKIIGLQANIWTEAIPTPARLDYMTMPRMTALAEVGWSSKRNWNDFSSNVSHHYSRWDEMDIKYRLPNISGLKSHVVFTQDAELNLKVPEGISEIRYTVDNTEATINAMQYIQPLHIDSTTTVKLLTLGLNGRAGNRYTIHFEKQSYLKSIGSASSKRGLVCRYFEGSYNAVSKIRQQDLKTQIIVDTIAIPICSRASIFALEFDGMIDIPVQGIYTFYLTSDDGSTLQVGDRLVIDNDGYHGSREVDGQVALEKGLHTFKLKYFDGGGGNTLKLMYEGPGREKQTLHPSLFKISNR